MKTQPKSAIPGEVVSCDAGDMPSEKDGADDATEGGDAIASSSADDTSGAKTADDSGADAKGEQDPGQRRISLSVRSLVVASLFLVLLAAAGTSTWLYFGERSEVQSQQRQAADDGRVEQIALDYAVNAATMDFHDLNAWKSNLVEGTTPAMNEKLSKAATQMEQLLVPLEWTSTAKPLVAKVRSNTNGIYVVDTFVSVMTTTTQAPDNLQSTATYSITIDSNDNWQISDVGGIGAIVAPN